MERYAETNCMGMAIAFEAVMMNGEPTWSVSTDWACHMLQHPKLGDFMRWLISDDDGCHSWCFCYRYSGNKTDKVPRWYLTQSFQKRFPLTTTPFSEYQIQAFCTAIKFNKSPELWDSLGVGLYYHPKKIGDIQIWSSRENQHLVSRTVHAFKGIGWWWAFIIPSALSVGFVLGQIISPKK